MSAGHGGGWRGVGVASLVLLLCAHGAQAGVPLALERFYGQQFYAADFPAWDDPTPYPNANGPVVLLMNPGTDFVRVRFTQFGAFSGLPPVFERIVPAHGTWVEPLPRLALQPTKTCATAPCTTTVPFADSASPTFRLSLAPTTPDPTATFAAAILNPPSLHRSDATFLIPTCSLGQTHRVGSYLNVPPFTTSCPGGVLNSSNSWIVVIATQANTSVQIFDDTPTTTSLYSTPTPLCVGDYLIWNQGADATAGDVTGFRVETSQPASVYSGSDCTAVGLPGIDCNSLLEAVPPDRVFTVTGTAYAVLPSTVRPFITPPSMQGS